jgi:hypothetical protein
MPEWYPLFKAAEYCHCPPWELLGQSVWWKDKALIALSAENKAAELRQKYLNWS